MSSIFRSSVKPDLSFIGVDMHSHLLPGLDDGLQQMEQTISFIEKLKEFGYHKLICTPHIISDIYPNNHDTILPKLDAVRKALQEKNIEIQIEAAAEYMVDIEMEKYIKADKPLLTFGKNLILIEMSYAAASPNIEQVIFHLRMKGLQPVLAHPERYSFYHDKFESYERFVELGCLLQINLLSLLGYYSKPVKAIAEKFVKNKMVDLLGTDMHHATHLSALNKLASQKNFYKLIADLNVKNKELLS
ncbi:MAG: tyrosine-protein phosphatase [Chitinophagaceae bacterium]